MVRDIPSRGKGGSVAEALQCPYCDLKFPSDSELNQHVMFDHPSRRTEEDDR
ncbi:MAG: hypothetical protein M3273_03935 [Actinomycetota bacterium]|nr:hypothetical protein [Actinomycetota bacterium]